MTQKTSSSRLVVLGAGPGGYPAAFHAADAGLSVTLVDAAPNPGGVCLYRGCIPSKTLLHVARLITECREAPAWGVRFGEPEIDLEKIRAWKDSVVQKLTGGLGQLCKKRQVRHLQGHGSFVNATTLRVQTPDGGEELVTFENAIIATGSVPSLIPGLPATPAIMDSTAALELASIPRTMLVVGGGYIGLELGSVYAALGTRVSVVEMTDGLLPGADRDLVQPLARRAEKLFAAVLTGCKVTRMQEEGEAGVRVTLEGPGAPGQPELYEKVLVSVGRKPNTAGCGLENTRAQFDARGFVKIDATGRTNEPTLWAVGDAAGEPMLAHKATHQGVATVEAILGKKSAFDPQAIPAVVFTDPEIAWCGLTETAAQKANRAVKVAKFPWAASGRAMTLGRTEGMTKIVADPGTDRVLGVGITGPGAGDLIAEAVLAVEMAATVGDLALTIHPHPTLSETLMEAADVYLDRCVHLYKPRRPQA